MVYKGLNVVYKGLNVLYKGLNVGLNVVYKEDHVACLPCVYSQDPSKLPPNSLSLYDRQRNIYITCVLTVATLAAFRQIFYTVDPQEGTRALAPAQCL